MLRLSLLWLCIFNKILAIHTVRNDKLRLHTLPINLFEIKLQLLGITNKRSCCCGTTLYCNWLNTRVARLLLSRKNDPRPRTRFTRINVFYLFQPPNIRIGRQQRNLINLCKIFLDIDICVISSACHKNWQGR